VAGNRGGPRGEKESVSVGQFALVFPERRRGGVTRRRRLEARQKEAHFSGPEKHKEEDRDFQVELWQQGSTEVPKPTARHECGGKGLTRTLVKKYVRGIDAKSNVGTSRPLRVRKGPKG